MRDDRRIPTSWLSVHRTVRGDITKCQDILVETSEDDPLMRWLGIPAGDRYLRYVLEEGFRSGRVCVAQPRAGVCVTTPLSGEAGLLSPLSGLRVLWTRFRFRLAAEKAKRAALKQGLREFESAMDPDGVLIRYLGVRRRFRERGLEPRLIRQSLPSRQASPVYLLTGRPAFARLLNTYEGTSVEESSLDDDGPSLFLCEVELESLLRGKTRA